MPSPDYEAFLSELAEIAGSVILPHFRALRTVENKDADGFDPVTIADREAEEAVREAIRARFPEHGIIGEEFADTDANAATVWVIDPIDGTRSFIAGLPIWGVLLGLVENGQPSLGLMAQPFTGERYFGDGRSARYDGPGGRRSLAARRCKSLTDAVLFTTDPAMFADSERVAYESIERDVRLARYSADCYAYCMLAAGFVDVVIETDLRAHDILPLVPIIEGAGGKITDWHGHARPDSGAVVASGDPRLHDQILERLAAS